MKDNKEKAEKAILALEKKTMHKDGHLKKKWISIATNCPYEKLKIRGILHLLNQKENFELSKTLITNKEILKKVIDIILYPTGGIIYHNTLNVEFNLSLFDSFSKEYKLIAYTEAIRCYSKKWDPLTEGELNEYSSIMHRMVRVTQKTDWPYEVRRFLNNDKNSFLRIIMEERRKAAKCSVSNKDHQYDFVDSKIFQTKNGSFKKKITKRCRFCGHTYSYEDYD